MASKNTFSGNMKGAGRPSKHRTSKNPHGLSDMHVRFCLTYAKCLNVAVAYKTVYPNAQLSTSMTGARELWKKPAIQAYIDELMHAVVEKKELSLEKTLETINDIMQDPSEPSIIKLSAAEKLMKYFGGYQRHQESGANKNIFIGMTQEQLDHETDKMLLAFKGTALSGSVVKKAVATDFAEIVYEDIDAEVLSNGKSK